jgi:ketosteroid isomerase-like protein
MAVTLNYGASGQAVRVRDNGMDVVALTLEAFNRRDLPALLSLLDDQVELRPFSAKLSGETYLGPEGVRRWLAELEDEWSEWRVELLDQRMVEESVLSIGRVVARARDNCLEMDLPAAFLSTVRGGHVMRLESFGDPNEALAAANQA